MMTRYPVMLKNNLPVIAVFLVLFTLASCRQGDKGSIRTNISGTFPEFKGREITLSEIDIDKANPVDTTRISDNGKFSFRFRRPGPGFYLLKVDNRNYITLVLDREKQVSVSSQATELRKGYIVDGSEDSELYRQFELFLETNRRKVDSLSIQFKDYQRSPGFQSVKMELDETYQAIFNDQQTYAKAFIDNHCQSLASLLVINRRFGQRKIMDEEENYRYFIRLDSCLSLKYHDNKHLVALNNRVLQLKERKRLDEIGMEKLAAGKKAPDIRLQDLQGKEVALSSLHGSPVIIYFWTSVDENSRYANLLLKEMMARSAFTGVKVYAIGLETYKEMWESAIKKDGIGNWIHVTDFLNIHSSATSLYKVPKNLPYFILLDSELIIQYRGSDFTQLESLLTRPGH